MASNFLRIILRNKEPLFRVLQLNQFRPIQYAAILHQEPSRNLFKDPLPTTEKSESLQAKNDPDTFGTLSHKTISEDLEDEGDLIEEAYQKHPPKRSQKLTTKEYANLIKKNIESNRVKEAIDILEERMIKEDRIKPENYIYNLVISGCARAGYSKKAFQLFTRMRQRGLKVTGGTYTSLFNACANAPWANDGLLKANRLREIMAEKLYDPNASNYNAMIKAYGRCGDLKTAFQIVDEMSAKGWDIQLESFNFLLQACASDRQNGFRHALLVWHKILQRNLRPDIYSFNAMLRCVRDCGVGDLEALEEVVQTILLVTDRRQQQESVETVVAAIDAPKDALTEDNVTFITGNELTSANRVEVVKKPNEPEILTESPCPNLLSVKPHLGNLVALNEVTKSEDRLLLIGGFGGLLNEMKHNKAIPDIKTFTELLEVIPSTNVAEKKLISTIRKMGIKVDVDFFNVLIKKRAMRFDYDGSREVMRMIEMAKLNPNIVTYGVLALSCQTKEQANDLLLEMENKRIRMNIQILGAMLKQGCSQRNFQYVQEILRIIVTERIKPNSQFLMHLHNFHNYCFNLIKDRHPHAKSDKFKSDFNNFKQTLENWKKELDLPDQPLKEIATNLTEHPYKQFRELSNTGMEKQMDNYTKQKTKHRRYPNVNFSKLESKDRPTVGKIVDS